MASVRTLLTTNAGRRKSKNAWKSSKELETGGNVKDSATKLPLAGCYVGWQGVMLVKNDWVYLWDVGRSLDQVAYVWPNVQTQPR